MVSLNPQLVGNIMAHILRIAASDKNNTGFLPTSHINMILGEPVGNISTDDFHSFFEKLNFFVDVEGTTIVPSCTPSSSLLPVDLETLDWKRSFFLVYYPLNFWNDFATMLLTSLTAQEDMEHSLTLAASININPVVLQSGAKLYVWKYHILLLLDDKSTFYIHLDSGSYKAEDRHLYRHIDVWLCGSLETQAKLMAIVSSTFETVSH